MNLWQAKPKAKSKAKAKAKASVKGRGKGRGRQVKGNGKGQHVEQEEHMPPQNEDEQLEQLEMEAEDLDVSPQDQDVPMLAAPEAIAPSPSLPFGHPDESPSNVSAEDVAVVPAAVAEAAAIMSTCRMMLLRILKRSQLLFMKNPLQLSQLFQPHFSLRNHMQLFQLQLSLRNPLQLFQPKQLSQLQLPLMNH